MSSSKATMSYCNDMFSSKEGEIVYNSSLRNTYRECRGLPNCVRIGQVTKPTLYILMSQRIKTLKMKQNKFQQRITNR